MITKDKKNDSGQAALVMVLIMTIISAAVISFAGRVTTEVRLQNMMTEGTNAFLVAQTGLEEAIQKKGAIDNVLTEGGSYEVAFGEEGMPGVMTDSLPPGSILEVVTSGGGGSLTGARVYWDSAGALPAAIFVTVDSGDVIQDYAYDTKGENGFVKVSSGGVLNGVSFENMTPELPLYLNSKSIKIALFGSVAKIGVSPVGGMFPAQSLRYKSSSSVGQSDKKTRYGLEYEESAKGKIPEIFDYVMFSNGAIIQ